MSHSITHASSRLDLDRTCRGAPASRFFNFLGLLELIADPSWTLRLARLLPGLWKHLGAACIRLQIGIHPALDYALWSAQRLPAASWPWCRLQLLTFPGLRAGAFPHWHARHPGTYGTAAALIA